MIWFRRNNGEFKLLKNSRYLPAYYFIPKEILDRNPAPLREIPRSFSKLMKDDKAIATIESDLFMLLMYDVFAYMSWHYMGRSEYMEIWSGYEPLWKFAHQPDVWINELEKAGILLGEDWVTSDPDKEIGFLSIETVSYVMAAIVPRAMFKYRMYEVERIAEEHRCFEDFDFRKSNQKTDFIRQWYHTRTRPPMVSLEEYRENYAENHDGQEWDAPDSSQDVQETVTSQATVDQFKATLSEKDMAILEMRMQGYTMEEIAEKLGYKNHSGVLKRIRKIGLAYEAFTGKDLGFEDDEYEE